MQGYVRAVHCWRNAFCGTSMLKSALTLPLYQGRNPEPQRKTRKQKGIIKIGAMSMPMQKLQTLNTA